MDECKRIKKIGNKNSIVEGKGVDEVEENEKKVIFNVMRDIENGRVIKKEFKRRE